QLRLWQVRERQLHAEILERYTAELDRLLGAITQTERELRLTRRITSGRHERDKDLLPFGTRTQLESRRLRPRISPEFENKLRLPFTVFVADPSRAKVQGCEHHIAGLDGHLVRCTQLNVPRLNRAADVVFGLYLNVLGKWLPLGRKPLGVDAFDFALYCERTYAFASQDIDALNLAVVARRLFGRGHRWRLNGPRCGLGCCGRTLCRVANVAPLALDAAQRCEDADGPHTQSADRGRACSANVVARLGSYA